MIREMAGNVFEGATKQTQTFKYVRSVMSDNGGCEHDVKNKRMVVWLK